MHKTRDEAKAQLNVIADDLLACWAAALKEFIETYNTLRVKWSKRSESSVIHDLVIHHIRQRFDDDHPYARARQKGNLSYLEVNVGIGGKFTMRFKKLNRDLSASNIRTQSVMSFIKQQQQVELPGVEKPVNVWVGYQPAEGSLLDSRIFVVCPEGFRIAWYWELTKSAEVVPLPQRQSTAKKPTSRVRPKKQPRTKVGDHGNDD